jgi:hypothetical protein
MKVIVLFVRVAALAVILLACRVGGASLAGFASAPSARESATNAPSAEPAENRSAAQARLFFLVAGVCLLEAGALAYPVLRSEWTGWKLAAAVFVVYLGVVTVQPQLEAAFFRVLPARLGGRILVMGTATAALFAPLAVLVLGRWRATGTPSQSANGLLTISPRQWVARLVVAAAVYVVLYFVFGFFVAWQSPQVREYYGGTASDGVWQHLMVVLRRLPLLLPLQALRGLLWVGLALPVLALMRGAWWEVGLAIGVLFAVLMNAQLLLPNPFMPEAVRLVHLVETAATNLLFGFWIGWSFGRSQRMSSA